ncbi:unnamed protein product, partial [Trichogramma brassicae]
MDSSHPMDSIRIERGIFQGDSLSPLWFCLALNPLSTLLRDSALGCRLRRDGEVISHLLFMDDLKLYAPKRPDLVKLLKITEDFSNSIRMEFGVDKCAVMHVQRGKVVNATNLHLSETISLRSLQESETYKYLGMSQSLSIEDGNIKQTIKGRFFCRLTKVLKSLLSGGNKARAFNAWVMPLLSYSFGILRWTQTELDALDRRVRLLLTTHRMLHPRSSVMRLYIPRKCGGRGFLNAKTLHNREVCNLRDYFLNSECGMHRDVVAVDRNFTPLSFANENWRRPSVLSTEDRKNIWKSKVLHGRFYRALTGPDVDLLASVNWLRFGDLFGETEGFVCAIADEVMMTNNYRRYILRDGTVDICRACRRPGESLRHIISGCSHLANGEYLHRHNLVAKIIHQQLALKYGLVESEVPYYKYTPAPVLENGRATLYWDRSVITDRTIVANKPDIVLTDRLTRQAILVDITIPHDENLVKAEKDKLTKYLDLAHEVTAMWDVDSTIIVPIVVSANGLIAKSLDQHLKRLSLDGWVKGQIQKAVLLDTARIVRDFSLRVLTAGSLGLPRFRRYIRFSYIHEKTKPGRKELAVIDMATRSTRELHDNIHSRVAMLQVPLQGAERIRQLYEIKEKRKVPVQFGQPNETTSQLAMYSGSRTEQASRRRLCCLHGSTATSSTTRTAYLRKCPLRPSVQGAFLITKDMVRLKTQLHHQPYERPTLSTATGERAIYQKSEFFTNVWCKSG